MRVGPVRPRSPRELVELARELRAREGVVDDTERRLLDEMLARPDDPAPRLVYADWLEDHGRSARAEHVRLRLPINADGAANPRSLLQHCYGVALPEEVFVVLDSGFDLPGSTTTLPWDLPTFKKDPYLRIEESVYAVDRELVPLLTIENDIVCYRLDELAAGRSTIFTLRKDFDEYTETERAADSLLELAHAAAVDALRGAEAEYASPANRGAGSIDREEVEWRREGVQNALRMQRELEARMQKP